MIKESPRANEAIKIPAKTVAKMRIAKVAKESIVPKRGKPIYKARKNLLSTSPQISVWSRFSPATLKTVSINNLFR
jgi:hypothetical protein